MKNFFRTLATICIFLIVTLTLSCKKGDKSSSPKPELPLLLPIEKIQATVSKNIDVAKRKDLRIVLRGYEYHYSVTNSQLEATPVKDPYLLPYSLNSDASMQPISQGNALLVQLMKAGYLISNSQLKDGPPPRPAVKDQNTQEDLVNSDMLVGKYFGLPSKNLSNVILSHANNLLDFEVKGFPDNNSMSVWILSRNDQFKAFKRLDAQYRAVITGDWLTPADLFIVFKADDKTYTIKVLNSKDIGQDRHYRITISYDKNNDGFTASANAETKWSEEIWPE